MPPAMFLSLHQLTRSKHYVAGHSQVAALPLGGITASRTHLYDDIILRCAAARFLTLAATRAADQYSLRRRYPVQQQTFGSSLISRTGRRLF